MNSDGATVAAAPSGIELCWSVLRCSISSLAILRVSLPSKISTPWSVSETSKPVTTEPSSVTIAVDRYFSATSALGSTIDSMSLARIIRLATPARFGPNSRPSPLPTLWQAVQFRTKTSRPRFTSPWICVKAVIALLRSSAGLGSWDIRTCRWGRAATPVAFEAMSCATICLPRSEASGMCPATKSPIQARSLGPRACWMV